MTLISTTTLTGASVSLSSIPQTYVNLFIVIQNFKPASNSEMIMRFNGDTTANRQLFIGLTGAQNTATAFNSTSNDATTSQDNTDAQGLTRINIPNYANTTTWKMAEFLIMTNDPTTTTSMRYGNWYLFYNQTGGITSLDFFCGTGNFTSGTILLYGVK